MDFDVAPEIAEPVDEAADGLGAVAPVEVGGAQILVGDAVAERAGLQ